jgi:hypothetical protein
MKCNGFLYSDGKCRPETCSVLHKHEKNHAEFARLDANRTAKPKTRLLGHARAGDCVGPGTVNADTLEDTATGERTPLDERLGIRLNTRSTDGLSRRR